jgi:hypothetical protein
MAPIPSPEAAPAVSSGFVDANGERESARFGERGPNHHARTWMQPRRRKGASASRQTRNPHRPASLAMRASGFPRSLRFGVEGVGERFLHGLLGRFGARMASVGPRTTVVRSLSVPAPWNSFGCSGGAAEGRQVGRLACSTSVWQAGWTSAYDLALRCRGVVLSGLLRQPGR